MTLFCGLSVSIFYLITSTQATVAFSRTLWFVVVLTSLPQLISPSASWVALQVMLNSVKLFLAHHKRTNLLIAAENSSACDVGDRATRQRTWTPKIAGLVLLYVVLFMSLLDSADFPNTARLP